METYFESAEGKLITPERAIKEMLSHGIDFEECHKFFNEYKEKESGLWDAQEILIFCGY